MRSLQQDIRFAIRQIVRRRGLAVAVTLTLAIGIGGVTAVFSFVNGVVLRPLPYADPDRLVAVLESNPTEGKDRYVVSPRNLEDWEGASTTVVEFGAWRDWGFRMATPEGLKGFYGGIASPSLFRLLGVRPAVGRLFRDDENVPGNDHVVLVSHRFWLAQLGGDAGVVGRVLALRGEPYQVVGVLPDGFDSPELGPMDIWAPLSVDEDQFFEGRHLRNRRVYARLVDGASVGDAQTELATIAARLASEYPESNQGWTVQVTPLAEYEVGETVRATFLAFAGAVVLVLLVACANVAHLLLAHAAASRRELAVRAALGCGRGGLVRHLVVLGVLLALAGGAVGAVVAVLMVRVLVGFAPAGIPRLASVAVDGRVLLFAAVISLVTGLLFSIIPALRASRLDLVSALKEGARETVSRRGRDVRSTLIAAEAGVTLVLLVAAGLLGRTVLRMVGFDPGFDSANLLTLQVFTPQTTFEDRERLVSLYDLLIDGIRALPTVRDVGATSAGPYFGGIDGMELRAADGPSSVPGPRRSAQYHNVSPGYFRTMGISFLGGRDFAASDRSGAPPVAVVNEVLARRLWPGESPIGRRVESAYSARGYTVVGIVADTRSTQWGGRSRPEIYFPYAQEPRGASYLVIRTVGDPEAIASQVRKSLHEIEPDLYVSRMAPVGRLISRELRTPRFRMFLVSAFGLIALALAVVGIYGIVSYAVDQRVPEMGLRMALGAQPAAVSRLVVGEGMRPVLVGLGAGLLGALAAARALRSLLFEVGPFDPVAVGGATLVLGAVALAASWLPARRAATVNPVDALRAE